MNLIEAYDGELVEPALGRVVDEGRGSLPFALVHGEALVACASWALSEAGVLPVDARTTVEGIVDAGAALVLHDALCPMTPPDFIAACVGRAREEDVVVVGTARAVDRTGDLTAELVVASPIVVPASVLELVGDLLDDAGADFTALTSALQTRTTVVTVEGPAAAARVVDLDDVRALEALTRPPVP